MRAGAVVQARMGSRRLPGKSLADVGGRPLLARVIDRVAASRRLAWLGVATTVAPEDDAIAALCDELGVPCHRGPVDDVLGRVIAVARTEGLDPVVRVTGDCPLVCPDLLDALLDALVAGDADYAATRTPTFHEGIDVFSRRALEAVDARARSAEEREHLALLVERHPALFRVAHVDAPRGHAPRPGLRLSVDEAGDLAFVRACYEALGPGPFATDALVALLDRRPGLVALRAGDAAAAPEPVDAAPEPVDAAPAPPGREAASPRTGADLVADALAAWGVPRIHLYPGGTIAPTLNAWIARGGAYVVARHEQGAGYAALAEARLSGEPRAVLVTSGPGVTNLVTVVADAWYDSVPLLALAGQVGTADLRSRPHVRQRGFQEVPASRLLEPVTKACFRPMEVAELPEVLDAALRAATSGRPGPVLVELPMDVQRATLETAARAQDPPRPTGRCHGAPAPDPALLDELAEWIAEAEQPVVLAGHGVLQARATGALRALAERFSLPVTTSLPAVGAFPGDHPLSLGFLGHTGTGWANRAVHDCDLLLVLGARLDVRQTGTVTDGFVREGRVARVDLDAHELAEPRLRADLALHADAGAVLEALGERLARRLPPPREAWLAAIKEWREALPLDAYPAGAGCHPARLLRALDAATRDRPLVAVTGVGHHQQWTARHMTFDWPERVLLTSSGHGAMGYDLPAAAGAAFARPDARVLCVVGDGSFQLNMQELGTLAEYGLPVKIAVLDNQRLAMVSQFQNLTWGSDPSTGDRAAVDFAGLARCYGFETFALDALDAGAEAVIERFVGTSGPALLRARIDPACEVSPMLLAGQTLDRMWTWKP